MPRFLQAQLHSSIPCSSTSSCPLSRAEGRGNVGCAQLIPAPLLLHCGLPMARGSSPLPCSLRKRRLLQHSLCRRLPWGFALCWLPGNPAEPLPGTFLTLFPSLQGHSSHFPPHSVQVFALSRDAAAWLRPPLTEPQLTSASGRRHPNPKE